MKLATIIENKLSETFAPETLTVEDESEKHRGHAGYREGGDSHFRVWIKAAAFEPMTRLQRHRAVHEALGADVMGRLHALALHIEA
ncbi:BolA family protein [Psychromarinibacter halotolerans]|uniref:BolA family protein n=1 Tax=Psychromarinibacter halotolerans TaxID=1775175 RepID=A0ABV7GSU3_9RHOB|nr:BolA family protein [Psychromarinibacter halotolerans]MAQ86461.1 BolA family transcriptional regulator [Maritimibacter sp.]MDF0598656.1 BolA family transcriptional regulator [Psychromarinibacter halotolerans]